MSFWGGNPLVMENVPLRRGAFMRPSGCLASGFYEDESLYNIILFTEE